MRLLWTEEMTRTWDDTNAPKVSGGDLEEATPDPIPNSEVKLLGADGTAREAVWESRTLPGLFRRAHRKVGSFFLALAAGGPPGAAAFFRHSAPRDSQGSWRALA